MAKRNTFLIALSLATALWAVSGCVTQVADEESSPVTQDADAMFTLIRKINVDPLGVVGQIDGCEFSKDNKYIIASDNHGTAHIYIRATGKEIARVKHIEIDNKKFERAGKINAVGYSHNGKYFYTGINSRGLKVWDAKTFELLHHLGDGSNTDGATFNSDDTWLVTGAGREVHLYTVPDFKRFHSFAHKRGEVNTVDFNHDESLLLSCASKGEVFITRTSDWKMIRRHKFKSSVKRGYFSPDGELYVLTGRDQMCKIFRSSNGEEVASLKHRGNLKTMPGDDYGDSNPAVEAVRWSYDGQFLFTGGVKDGIMRVWRRADWSLIGYVQAQEANRQVEYIHVSSDNEVIVGGDEGVLYHYAFTPPKLLKPFAQGEDGIICLEAENYDTSLPQGGHRWTAASDAGAAGGKSLQALPNNGTEKVKNFARYDPLKDSPKLDYRVNFTRKGTYHVWVRVKGGDSDNSLHVGVDGKKISSADKIQFPASKSDYVWTRATADDKNATVTIPSTGLHTINVWMAEDGTTLDRILLTPDDEYDPSGVNGGKGPDASGRQTPDRQAGFRIRSAFDARLNADQGWAAALGENVTIFADEPFRIRFEVEGAPGTSRTRRFRLQVRRNGKSWEKLEAHDFPHPETKGAKTPRVSLVACAAYRNGASTTDLLHGSSRPFQPGAAVSLADRTAPWTGGPGHGEFEWALVVRRFADGVVTNEPGDTFEFRMTAEDGTPLDEMQHPILRLAVRPGHVGGTFVETPGRIGPFQAGNGDLYFIMEPSETDNIFMMIKSSDQGRTWKEVDGANRPPTRDLESVDARHIGDTIHIIHQVTKSVLYHSFRTSDHPKHPDTWAVRGERAGKVKSVAQAATLAARSDGSLVAFYVGRTKIHSSIRGPSGEWREVAVIGSALSPQCIRGADDVVHLAYYSPDGSIWYRRLSRKGALSKPQRLASGLKTSRSAFGSVLPLLYHSETDTLFIVYRLKDGALWERRVVGSGDPTPAVKATDRAVVQHAVDSQQPAADVFLDGETLHILFVDKTTRSIYATHNDGGWQPSKLLVDKILGSWIRGSVYTRPDGTKVIGYVYDAGSDGGAGMNRFREVRLSRP